MCIAEAKSVSNSNSVEDLYFNLDHIHSISFYSILFRSDHRTQASRSWFCAYGDQDCLQMRCRKWQADRQIGRSHQIGLSLWSECVSFRSLQEARGGFEWLHVLCIFERICTWNIVSLCTNTFIFIYNIHQDTQIYRLLRLVYACFIRVASCSPIRIAASIVQLNTLSSSMMVTQNNGTNRTQWFCLSWK